MLGPMSSCGTQGIRLAADYANFLAPRSLLDRIHDQENPTSYYVPIRLCEPLVLLYSHPKPFSEESNAPRVRSLAPTQAGGSGTVVADIAKLSVGREAYYTRELATDHQQYLSGHGESP